MLLGIAVFGPLSSAATAPRANTSPPNMTALGQDQRAEFDRRFKEARGDWEKLWELHRFTEARSMRNEGRRVLREILAVDDGDPRANELLGHLPFDGRWFKDQKQLDAYILVQDRAEALAKGYVEYEGGWVAPEDIPYLQRGLVRAADRSWVTPEVLVKMHAGWVRHDLEWVPPEDAVHIDAGLYKCGDEWLELDAANAYHAQLDLWWRLPGSMFNVYSTLDRADALKVLEEIETTVTDLQRVFGARPLLPQHVLVLRSAKQYNQFTAGVDKLRAAMESRGLSSVHGASFADLWIDLEQREYLGCGVTYYDASSEAQRRFGRLFVRHAAALSFIEGIDSSPKTRAAFKTARRSVFNLDAHQKEKRIHPLMRRGAAAYVERYFIDPASGTGVEPDWTRRWSVSNLERLGGIPSVERMVEMKLRVEDPSAAGNLLNAAGLFMAFVLDGDDPHVKAAHDAWKVALNAGGDMKAADTALFAAMRERESALRAFAKR